MLDEPASIDKLAWLVRDVFRLRSTMQQNLDDANLVRDGVKIHYLLDPDVLELYVRPDTWTKSVAALPSLRKLEAGAGTATQDDETSPLGPEASPPPHTVLEATALLTGEYIFSRQLIGSDGNLFIAPEHTAEFLGHVARIETRSHQAAYKAASIPDQLEDLRSRLNYERQKNVQGLVSADRWLSQSRMLLVEGLAGVSHSALLASHRLERLLEKTILADAASLACFTPEIIAPDRTHVEQLGRDITELKSRNPISSTKEAIEADAVTLAQLMMLNDGYLQNKSAYVLITRDRSLHTIYAKWVREKARNKAHDETPRPLFALRFPRQYVPILNVSTMGGDINTNEIFKTIEQAIHDLTALFLSNDTTERDGELPQFYEHELDFRRTLYRIRNASRSLTPIADSLWELIKDIAVKWSLLMSYAVAAKSDIIEELMEKETTYWNALITKGKLEYEFGSQSRNVANQFERLATSSTLLRQEIWALNEIASKDGSPSQESDNQGKREIASTFNDFRSTPFMGKTLESVISEGPRGSEGIKILQGAEVRAERLLVSGAICLEIGAWEAARNLLDRARYAAQPELSANSRDHSAIFHEIQFFSCVARRLAANADNWATEYAAVAKDLARLERTDVFGPFGRARILAERMGLALCSLSWAVRPSRLTQSREANRYAEDALSLLKTIHENFGGSPLFKGRELPGWVAVIDHLTLNIMIFAFWWHTLKGELDHQLRTFTNSAIGRRDELRSSLPAGSAHSKLYPELAQLVLAADSADKTRIRLIDFINEVLTHDRKSSFAFDLPATDRAEFGKIKVVLAAELGKPH
jgi:hypothetical protein